MSHIVDLHCHPSFKPYNNLKYKPNVNIWDAIPEDTSLEKKLPKSIRKIIAETAKSSQSNLNDLIKGNVKGVFFVIHPIERGWFFRRKESPHPVRRFLLKQVLKDHHIDPLAASLSGMALQKATELRTSMQKQEKVDYYMEETYPEYKFIRDSETSSGKNGASFKIVRNYDEYVKTRKKPKSIAVILTIEGGHALNYVAHGKLFFKEYHELSTTQKDVIRKAYLDNIDRIKGHGTNAFNPSHTPFFITLVHFYNNFLSGHAKSYRQGTGAWPGMDDLLDQETALDDGITPLGYEVIEKLLERSKGRRRILIDVKHMSLQARKEYYRFVSGRKQNRDRIPIIYSHGAVNGASMSFYRGYDSNVDEANTQFSNWSINLYNEDITSIFESDGLIGLDPHEGRMPGRLNFETIQDLKRGIGFKDHRSNDYKKLLNDEYMKLFLGNVFQIIATVGSKKAWDIITLGSDYDGIMNPFDFYPKSSDFQSLAGHLLYFLSHPQELLYAPDGRYETLTVKKMKKLMYGYSAKEVVEKIFSGNVENFLSKYFTDQYLNHKSDLVPV